MNFHIKLAVCVLSFGASFAQASPPRNLILLIGDGMGPQAAGLLLNYARYAPRSEYGGAPSALERAMQTGSIGVVLPKTYDWLTGDSAALSTALASGVEARPAVIGADKDGAPVENMTALAQRAGKAVGLVSDTRITHATPAGFAARSRHRDLEAGIAADLLRTAPEVMLSGGLDYFIPAEGAEGVPPHLKNSGKRKDGRDLLKEARSAGYAVVFDRSSMEKAAGPRLLGLFDNSRMTDAITALGAADDPARKVPLLEEMAVKALQTLSRDEDGFFLMVEAGQIDTAGHQNDPGRLLHEMLVFDRTLAAILKWMSGRRDTLLVVTADHETGGFSFNYSREGADKSPVAMSGSVFGGEPYTAEYDFAAPELLSRLRLQKRSFEKLLKEFSRLPAAEMTPSRLASLVSAAGPAPITEAEASAALAGWDGPTRKFYTDEENAVCAALSRQVSPKLNISWATGSHSATPFFLVALGHESAESVASGVMSAAEAGKRMIETFLP
ncbi:MAG: alkaline phosphatase [Elusimicrobia bacterium]|nr:MAG: alkaline phosphatase [Elusimicrobiota bacterium]KAF0156119.1 MAG: alkaline phosphatase [Elusimicrobiota bacterium]